MTLTATGTRHRAAWWTTAVLSGDTGCGNHAARGTHAATEDRPRLLGDGPQEWEEPPP